MLRLVGGGQDGRGAGGTPVRAIRPPVMRLVTSSSVESAGGAPPRAWAEARGLKHDGPRLGVRSLSRRNGPVVNARTLQSLRGALQSLQAQLAAARDAGRDASVTDGLEAEAGRLEGELHRLEEACRNPRALSTAGVRHHPHHRNDTEPNPAA